ncbi:hypothetical protein EVAR_767_1 [Eumeta japonica]|uniref:Uncharacterized protein n=1 Tax=Eumeta variegata TaxID=151549 RepID=A0A4C1SEW7_EUMVA|nr:hypothetical protein EVAR_767_1 [Eumeta japonica]
MASLFIFANDSFYLERGAQIKMFVIGVVRRRVTRGGRRDCLHSFIILILRPLDSRMIALCRRRGSKALRNFVGSAFSRLGARTEPQRAASGDRCGARGARDRDARSAAAPVLLARAASRAAILPPAPRIRLLSPARHCS